MEGGGGGGALWPHPNQNVINAIMVTSRGGYDETSSAPRLEMIRQRDNRRGSGWRALQQSCVLVVAGAVVDWRQGISSTLTTEPAGRPPVGCALPLIDT